MDYSNWYDVDGCMHLFSPGWHINPSEAVRIEDAIKAKRATYIHWGTFHLAFEGVLKLKQDLELALETAKKDPKSFERLDLGGTVVVDTSIWKGLFFADKLNIRKSIDIVLLVVMLFTSVF